MASKTRKLTGMVALVAFVIAYAFVAMLVAIALLPGTSQWLQVLYYLFAGCFWAWPATYIIRWMEKRTKTDHAT
jgi:membrane protein implicated in regulation of membrane protease activity